MPGMLRLKVSSLRGHSNAEMVQMYWTKKKEDFLK